MPLPSSPPCLSIDPRPSLFGWPSRLRDVESKQRHGDPKHRDSVVHWEWTVYAALASCPELLTQSDKCKTWEDQCWAYFQVSSARLTRPPFSMSRAHHRLLRV